MSTRSRIGIENEDGTIRSIYCHFDGYPEGVGKELMEHYTDPKKINELLDLGDISSLGEEYDEELVKSLQEKENRGEPLTDEEKTRQSKMTFPYKDRGENVPARLDMDEWEYSSKAGSCGEEWVYLFKKDWSGVWCWHYIKVPYFEPLEEKLEED